LQFARIFDQDDAVAGLGDFGKESIDQSCLAGRRATRDQDVLPVSDSGTQQVGLLVGHDSGLDVITKGKHRHRRPADGKARCSHHGWHQTFEAFSTFRQLGRNAGTARMDLETDMVGDEPDDPFGVRRSDPRAGVLEASRKAVDPESAVRVQHHLDDTGVLEMTCDQGAERGAQHARPASDGF